MYYYYTSNTRIFKWYSRQSGTYPVISVYFGYWQHVKTWRTFYNSLFLRNRKTLCKINTYLNIVNSFPITKAYNGGLRFILWIFFNLILSTSTLLYTYSYTTSRPSRAHKYHAQAIRNILPAPCAACARREVNNRSVTRRSVTKVNGD